MDRLRCPECEKTFRTEAGLNWHMKRAHSKTAMDDQAKAAAMAQEPALAEPPTTPTRTPTPAPESQPTEKKREVYISYVKANP